MIRALLMTKWSKSVAGPMVTTWNYPTLHHLNAHTVRPRAVSLNPDRSFSAEGGSDDKPKNVPHGFVAPGFPSTSSPLGSNPGNNTRGKLGRAEPLDSIVRSKGTSNDDKKSEAQKKASEAKEAAAKQLQDVMANLPSKEQTEKYFFRVVAFFYDLTYLTCTWLLNFVEHNIVRNATVQHYWKRFHEKMEQAKKD
ncbi:uncharacterized protein LOC6533250 isoform X2 [Drosophila yakuba]|uniref:Uncharacterized protein, isoform B n=1 Tax=Drosophila yakuba TaxID=7245 RepID=A0A0R1DVZ8_DROYA|nr:uncharacterized protein LOC6533250 isoform X2 [Drosophila yakuba]KRK01302.1 uncharacterized protein Dyak_GE20455, isoform B [Drosophila yakuba]